MSQIIPAILALDEQDFKNKSALVRKMCGFAQIDVLDGTMFGSSCWADPKTIAAQPTGFGFDAHLMVAEPEIIAAEWIATGARRIIIHAESVGKPGRVFEKAKELGRQFGMAVNPETGLDKIEEYSPFLDYLLIMGVDPGMQGRPLNAGTIGRVRAARSKFPDLAIGVDGGVTDAAHLARELAAAGADELVVGSAIWKAKDPLKQYGYIAADARV